MKYLLDQSEMEELVPKEKLIRQNMALQKARKLILELSGFNCKNFCYMCPIGDPFDSVFNHEESRMICRENRNYPK